MDFDDIIRPENTLSELQASDKWQAIDELITNLIVTGKIDPALREEITAAVRSRETSMSTGIGSGIAIPHASTDLVNRVTAALGRSIKGIPFEAPDDIPAKVVVLLLIPKSRFQEHLHILATIAKLLHRK
jgi:mannitol/fructose-specific phosphotransferase system IIA component (Ntr-type)